MVVLLGTRHALSLSLVTLVLCDLQIAMFRLCCDFRLVPLVFPRIIITERTLNELPERTALRNPTLHFARPLGFAAAHHRHGLRGTEAQ